MIATEIDLTSSLHILSKYKLRLAVTASARVSLRRPDSLLLTSLTLSEIFSSRDTWVSLGPELKLTVDAYLNGTVPGPGRAALVLSDIGRTLGHVELWSNLGLVVKSLQNPETMLGDQDATRLVYTIQPDSTLSQDSQVRRAPSPTIQLHDVNIQPPEGIPTAVLQEIMISLCFVPFEQISKPPSYPMIKQEEERFDDLLIALDYVDSGQINTIGIPGDLQPDFTKSQGVLPQFPHPTDNFREYLEDDSPFSSQESQLSCPQPWQEQVARDTTTENVDTQPYIMLIDSGFRSLICDKPIRPAAGIKTHFDEPRIELASAAPAIFSPRYLSSMSQRAGYVPMIAKSINAMLERTKSLRLKERPKLLEDSCRARTGTVSDESTAKLDTRSTLKCLLWMSLQRGVFDPGAARRLESLHSAKRWHGVQPHVEKQPTLTSHQSDPYSDPMIDIPDDPPFEPENHITSQPTNEDPYHDLLFSELGLYEEDDQPHNSNAFDENLHLEPNINMDDDDFFNYLGSPPRTPRSDIDEILDPPTSPPPNPNSPTLPIQLLSQQPIPMNGISPLQPPSIPTHPSPSILPTSGSDFILPSSPPPIPPEDWQFSDDMLLT